MVDQADIQSISPLSPQQQGMLLETLSSTESGLHIEQLPGLAVTTVKSSTQARYDLELLVSENPQGLKVSIEYSTALVDAATIDRLSRHYETLLASVAAQPSMRLSALSARLVESDRQQDSIRQRELQAADLQKLTTIKRKAVRQ